MVPIDDTTLRIDGEIRQLVRDIYGALYDRGNRRRATVGHHLKGGDRDGEEDAQGREREDPGLGGPPRQVGFFVGIEIDRRKDTRRPVGWAPVAVTAVNTGAAGRLHDQARQANRTQERHQQKGLAANRSKAK